MYKVNSQPLKIFFQYCAKEKNILFNPQELSQRFSRILFT